MSDLLDKISIEYDREMQKPEDSFTMNDFMERKNLTRGEAQYFLAKRIKSGAWKRKLVGSTYYYYAGE